MKQNFIQSQIDTLRLTVYDNNRPLIPSSGTVTLYKPSGETLQAAAAVTIDGTTGEMTYALTATHTAAKDLNYKAVWAYVVSGTTYYQTQLFDIVLSQLGIPITDEDLFNELDSLRKAAEQATATATAGAAGSLTDTKRRESDDYWKGGTIEIVAGTGIGQRRDITGFTQSTGVFTVTPNFGTAPDSTSKYVIVKSFSSKIIAAFDKLQTMLYDKGKRHELIIESSQITVPLVYLTIHMIALDLMDESDDKWSRLATIYWDKFDKSFGAMKLDYDEDESGLITEDEEMKSPTELRIGRA
jgi:hypothetical protein